MATIKLYDQNGALFSFSAQVLSCEPEGDSYAVVLNATAFFPEEGGQYGDTGTLGGVVVTDTQIDKNGVIRHLCQAPLPVNETVEGQLDWEVRFRKMQNHTGEHILSGLIDKKYHLRNVGFHLGHGDVTCDYDGVLTDAQLRQLETQVNHIILRNLPVSASYPSPQERESMTYRAKLDLTENVRIVRIEGVDACACCAPHVKSTGEVGLFKITGSLHYKGGIRIHMLCGLDALEDYRRKEAELRKIARSLSVKEEAAAGAVAKQTADLAAVRFALVGARRALLMQRIENMTPTEGNFLFMENDLDAGEMRFLLHGALPKCGGVCAVFSGNDEQGYTYVIGSQTLPLRGKIQEINTTLNGRGGGSDAMLQGFVQAGRSDIEKYFKDDSKFS